MKKAEIDFDKPYTSWLDESVRQVYEQDLQSIAIVGRTKDGYMFSGYFQADFQEMGAMADAIQNDRIMLLVRANIEDIREALEEDDEESDE